MLLSALFSLCLLCLTSAYSPLCVRGPEYWCRDASTAQDCGAIRHCQQTVWREQEVSEVHGTPSRMLCNVLVQATSQLVNEGKMNRFMIKKFLRNDCTQLPDENNLVQQCQMAVDLYLDDILRHIDSHTVLSNICPIIQGHDLPSTAIQLPSSLSIDPNKTCVLCEFVVHLLQVFASANSTETELTQLLEKVCSIMPETLKNECKLFVDEYGSTLVEILAREFDPPKACRFIKLCPKSMNVAFLIQPDDSTCGLCDYVETYLSMGNSKDKVCTHFRGERREQCDAFVQISSSCSKLPVCFDKDYPVKEMISLELRQAGDSTACTLCKYVVTYLDAVLQNNKSEAAVIAALEKVCDILPETLLKECDSFVDTYGPILAQLLVKYATPDEVCKVLKLCVKGISLLPVKDGGISMQGEQQLFRQISAQLIDEEKGSDDLVVDLKPSMQKDDNIRNDVECSLCRYVMSYVNVIIKANATEADVEKALEFVCSILPSDYHSQCTMFVKEYSPVLVQMLAELDDPNTVCKWLNLCTDASLASIENQVPTVVSTLPCTLCEYVVHYLDVIIQSNSTEAKVEDALKKVCSIIPDATLEGQCELLVHLYGPVIVKLLADKANPKAVCGFIGLCDKFSEGAGVMIEPSPIEHRKK